MPRFEIQNKVWLVLYLITTQGVFALPDPVFVPSPVYIHPQTQTGRSNNGESASGSSTSSTAPAATTEPTGGTGGGEEPVVAASSYISSSDNLNVAEESFPFARGARAKRPRPPRRHPPPMKVPMPPPPHKPLVLKHSSIKKAKKPSDFKVPKKPQKNRHPNYYSDIDLEKNNRRPSVTDLMMEDPPPPNSSYETKSREVHHSKYSSGSRDRNRSKERDHDHNRSFIRDEYYSSGGNSGGYSGSVEDKSPPPPPPPPSKSVRSPKPHPFPHTYPDNPPPHSHNPLPAPSAYHGHDDGPAPFPKPARPVKLSYYYDSNDKQDLKTLITSHHLKRRGKECDGLENFIYDLEVISFLMGLVSTIIGMYSDVIPFFNDGVKISYSNNYGDGVDYPHEYWNNHDAKIDAVLSKRQLRTISIGTNQDNVKEVVSVAGEFMSLASLGIGFVGLFPSLVEKFFYSLDWWFGKRGLWKQYLYTYKCEIHPYSDGQQGWGWNR